MKRFVVTIIFFSLLGCTNKASNRSGVLSKEKMQAVLWDIIGADVFTEQFVKKDSSKNASFENVQLQNKIFAIHKVTRADFYKSFDYYNSHNALMLVILDSMTAKAERDRSNIMTKHYKGNPK
jgi:Domain of unknown function (DUF4296)